MAWGGARVGAGRKPKSERAKQLAGSRRRRPKPPEAPQFLPTLEPPAPTPVTPPTFELAADAQAVWTEFEPLARQQRTLMPETAGAFLLLCQNIALERAMRRNPELIGGSDHRGMMRIVEIGMARFCLVPNGKPVAVPEPPKDEWADFDGPVLVKGLTA